MSGVLSRGRARRLPPFDQLTPLLQAIPSLPRPVLTRLTERLLERLDEMDGDPDLEPEEDRCEAGDDGCAPVFRYGEWHAGSMWDECGT